MRETIRAMNRLLEPEGVEGVALVASDSTVFMTGFASDAATIVEMTGSARHIFRQTRPRPFLLDLAFRRGRVLVLPIAGTVIWLQTAYEVEAFAVVRELDRHLRTIEALDLCQSGVLADNGSGQDAPKAPSLTHARRPLPGRHAPMTPNPASPLSGHTSVRPLPLPAALDILAAAAEQALKTLGGPVVRNYLRKSRKRLTEDHRSQLDDVDIDLEAQLDAASLRDDPAVIAALGAWTRAFIHQTAAVIPEMTRIDLDVLAGDAAPTLAAAGFFKPSDG